jgi:hypothetical protein
VRADLREFGLGCAEDSARYNLMLQREFHSIVGDAGFDTSLGGHCVKFGGDFAFASRDNFRTAMRDDGSRDALFLAPGQLRANRRVTD